MQDIYIYVLRHALLQEFDIVDDAANIYKQIGPVLLKQDKTEAVMAVNGRLEFIDKQMHVCRGRGREQR